MNIIGGTAIEDELQYKLQETIKFIRKSGIKFWVLTGDKKETARNIALSAKLFDKNQKIFDIKGNDKQIQSTLSTILKSIKREQNDFGVLIDGDILQILINNSHFKQ